MNITTDADTGACEAVLSNQATATDNCNVTITTDAPTGFVFPIGTTTVNVTATDDAGNTATASYTVTVVDNEAPTVSCPGTQNVSIAQGAMYEIPDYIALGTASAADNCTFTTTQSPAPGTMVAVGSYPINIEVTDASGNAVDCSFNLIVDTILGVDENTIVNDFSMYPNPATTTVTLESLFSIKSVEIYNVMGQKVLANQAAGEVHILDVANLPSGIYLVRVTDQNGNKGIKKLVKK